MASWPETLSGAQSHRGGGRRFESVRGLNSSPSVRAEGHLLSEETPKDAVLQGTQADDGTRTHDLLHGKCRRAFAPVRSRSPKPDVCSGFGCAKRTRPNPSERRVQPLQPLSSSARALHNSRKNSSRLIPDASMIPLSVPLARSRACIGTTTRCRCSG